MEKNASTGQRQISSITVANMIHLCAYMFRPLRPFAQSLWDVSKLSTVLFGMGFENEFLQKCEYIYGWNFASLFPALYDGSFFDETVYGRKRGQQYLLGFATFLCGVFVANNQYRTNLNSTFEKSLLDDGYQFVEGKLVEVGLDTSVSPELTALPNRAALVRELVTGMQETRPVTILFVDLDHFKDVNDQLGHDAGNQCLAEIAQIIAEGICRKGKLYRVGGDEFCVMLPNFSTQEAAVTAERIRTTIDGIRPFGGIVKVTASIGVAGSDAEELNTPDSLIKAADDAMYTAKFTNRNRVVSWPMNPEESAQAEVRRKVNSGR